MATVYVKLGNKVKELRKKKSFSQEQLADMADLDLTSINEIESGVRNPSLRTIYKISLALKVSLKDLFSF